MLKDKREEKKHTRNLLIRISLVGSVLTTVILLLSGYIIDYRHFQNYNIILADKLETVNDAIEAIMLNTEQHKLPHIQLFVNILSKNTLYDNLRIISLDSQVIISSNKDELRRDENFVKRNECKSCHSSKSVLSNSQNIYITESNNEIIHHSRDIVNKKACQKCHAPEAPILGYIVGDFSMETMRAEIQEFQLDIIIVGIVLLTIYVFFNYFFLNFMVFAPLSNIVEYLRRITERNNTDLLPDKRDDIIGYIYQQINKTVTQLRYLYSNMEKEVLARTSSLKTSESALNIEKNKLEFIFEESPQAIIGVTSKGKVTFLNNKAKILLNINPSESNINLKNKMLKKILNSNSVKTSTKSKQNKKGTEQFYDTNNKLSHFEINIAYVKSNNIEPMLLIMLVDITDEKKLQQNLERHERLASIGQLVAGVAHEVGNPLSAISSLVQLSQITKDSDDLEHNLDLINIHINRITRIVQNMSNFTRISNEKKIKTELSDILRGAIEIASFDNKAKTIEMNFSDSQDKHLILVKRDQLMQAFLNIIMNSIDAVKDVSNPQINISISKKDSMFYIEFTDNGKGITDRDKEKIFEPFYTTKQIGKGTGLGLSVTYRIIEDLNGRIDVESKIGKGTTFTILLPVDCE